MRAWTQADFVRRIQLAGWDADPATLNRIEKQKRTVTDSELILMARVLKISLKEFENL
jgi:hypothetical protein